MAVVRIPECQLQLSFEKSMTEVDQIFQSLGRECSIEESGVSPYRKYIELIMKSSGPGKSFSFLHRIHSVIKKTQISLEHSCSKCSSEIDTNLFEDEVDADVAIILTKEDEDELRRYCN